MTVFHTSAEVAALFPKATKRWVDNIARAGEVAYTLGPKRAVLFTDAQRDAFIAHLATTTANTTFGRRSPVKRRTS